MRTLPGFSSSHPLSHAPFHPLFENLILGAQLCLPPLTHSHPRSCSALTGWRLDAVNINQRASFLPNGGKCVQVVSIDMGGSAMPSPKTCRKRGSGTFDWLTGLPPVDHLPTLPPNDRRQPRSSRWGPARRAKRHPIASQIAVIGLSFMQMGGKLCHSAPASGLLCSSSGPAHCARPVQPISIGHHQEHRQIPSLHPLAPSPITVGHTTGGHGLISCSSERFFSVSCGARGFFDERNANVRNTMKGSTCRWPCPSFEHSKTPQS